MSLTVGGEGVAWTTQESRDLDATAREAQFAELPPGEHKFKISARYETGTYTSEVVRTVMPAPNKPVVVCNGVANGVLSFTVSGTSDYSSEIVTQSNAARGTKRQDGQIVSFTFANPVSSVGTHWVALYVTDNLSGARAVSVYVTNPPESHPLCSYAERSVAAAARRGRAEGKLVFLLSTGEPDGMKFGKVSGFLASNEVVSAVKDKYVFAELCAIVPEQREIVRNYWREQPVAFGMPKAAFSPETRGYAFLVDPRHETEPLPCNPTYGVGPNSQCDFESLSLAQVVIPKLTNFLGQDFGVVVEPEPEEGPEPSIDGGDVCATVSRNAEGQYVVTPTCAGAYLFVNDAGTNVFVVPPDVLYVGGVPRGNLKVSANGCAITGAFAFNGDDENGYLLTLDGDGAVTVGEETISVTPQFSSTLDDVKPIVAGSKIVVGVKTIPGLVYALVRGQSLTAAGELADETEVAAETATAARLSLIDGTPPKGGAFYRVRVAAPGITPE